MDFWRGEAYSKFFDHLESKGGFYYEVSLRLQPSLPDFRSQGLFPPTSAQHAGCYHNQTLSSLHIQPHNRTTAQPHNHPFNLIDADGPLTHSNSVGATHPSTASAPRSSRARTRSTSSTTSGTSTRPLRTVRAAQRYGARRTAHARSLAASVSLECFGSSVFNDVLTNLGLFAPWGL